MTGPCCSGRAETTLGVQDLHDADEIFSVGNYGKVVSCTRFETRELNAGPIFAEARARYFAFAETAKVV